MGGEKKMGKFKISIIKKGFSWKKWFKKLGLNVLIVLLSFVVTLPFEGQWALVLVPVALAVLNFLKNYDKKK